MKRLSLFRRDERGTAIVELALVAPILALMLAGTVDISNGFSRKLQLEQAAQRSIEKIMNTTATSTVEATLQQEAADQAGVPTSNVTVTYRIECNGTQSLVACSTGQTQAQWISVVVTDKYQALFPLYLFGSSSSDGYYHVSATAGVRIQ